MHFNFISVWSEIMSLKSDQLKLGFSIFLLKVLCHVAYEIKGNGAKSTMQAHILSLYTHSTGGVRCKGQNILFECGYIAYQIKGKEV